MPEPSDPAQNGAKNGAQNEAEEAAGNGVDPQPWSSAVEAFREQQRSRILAAARVLLRTTSLAEISVSMLAEEAGLSRQTFYKYYDTAAGALSEAGAEVIREIEAELAPALEAADLTPGEKLALLARTLLLRTTSAGVAGPMVDELSEHDSDVVIAELRKVRTRMIDILEAGVDDGSFEPTVQPERDSYIVLSMLGSFRSIVARVDDPSDAIERAVEMVVRSVESRGER